MKVVFSPRAIDRLAEIEQFLVDAGSAAKAKRVVTTLQEKARLLRTMPRMGRVVPELGDPDVRELVIPPYRLVYEVNESRDLVEVHTIIHGRQQFPVEEFLDD